MANNPDRAPIARLVIAYGRIAEESPGMGDPDSHEVEDQLFDAIADAGLRAVIKNGSIYLPDPNGLPGENALVDPAEPEDLADPAVLNLNRVRKTELGRPGPVAHAQAATDMRRTERSPTMPSFPASPRTSPLPGRVVLNALTLAALVIGGLGIFVPHTVMAGEPPQRIGRSTEMQADVSTVVEGNNRFALDLHARLRADQPGNLFFSPGSLSTALAMAYAGARGETESQMAKVLHFTLPPEKLHPSFASLNRTWNPDGHGRGFRLGVANRLWGQEGFHFLPGFLAITRDDYGAELAQVDFGGQTEQAAGRSTPGSRSGPRGRSRT